MKAKRIAGISLLIILLISGYLCFAQLEITSGKDSFENIKVAEVIARMESQEKINVYYGQQTCGACRVFTPVLKEAEQLAGSKIYFLDGDNLETKEFAAKYNIQGTPTLLMIGNGKMIRHEGVLELDETVEILAGKTRAQKADAGGFIK